ncbi:MAG: hypothetical protein ACOYVK_12080 [Bacillota bacterium]
MRYNIKLNDSLKAYDVNGHLGNVIREDRKAMHQKDGKSKHGSAKFCSDCINDDIGSLDITV